MTVQPPMPEPRDVLSDRAYDYLEAEIVSGRWQPNAKISLRSLAQKLGMSIQPVRDAVSRLAALSALEITPGRSVRVPLISRETADELWSMRLLLEAEVASLAAQRRTEAQVAALFDITERMTKETNGNQDPEMTLDWTRFLIAACNSPMLQETVLRLQLRYAPFMADCLRIGYLPSDAFQKFTMFQQHELVLAIERQDAVTARHLRCADIRSFQRHLYACRGWVL